MKSIQMFFTLFHNIISNLLVQTTLNYGILCYIVHFKARYKIC